jgi:hypothetical protein
MAGPFIAVNARDVLARHGLDSFEALWSLQLEPVDAPNTERGGWSGVYRLEIEDVNGTVQSFYLKRQEDYLARSLRRPFGEPTFAREFRAIQEYAHRGVPALETAFFEQRTRGGKQQAILLTRALDAYRSLDRWFSEWRTLDWRGRQDLILAAAALVRTLHNTAHIHNCLYPKHIFLKLDGDGAGARLIDLEKTRPAWFGERDYVRDLESLQRRSQAPSRTQRLRFLLAYLGRPRLDDEARRLLLRVTSRQVGKMART